jgi:hypothetical protein
MERCALSIGDWIGAAANAIGFGRPDTPRPSTNHDAMSEWADSVNSNVAPRAGSRSPTIVRYALR